MKQFALQLLAYIFITHLDIIRNYDEKRIESSVKVREGGGSAPTVSELGGGALPSRFLRPSRAWSQNTLISSGYGRIAYFLSLSATGSVVDRHRAVATMDKGAAP